MKRLMARAGWIKGGLLATIVAGVLLAGGAAQAAVKVSAVVVTAPIIASHPGVAYFTIKNSGPAADRLMAISSPDIGHIEMHESMMAGGMMTMKPIPAAVIPAAGELVFKPGSYHAMLFDFSSAAKVGATVPLTFSFEKAGKITVNARIGQMGSH